VEYFCAANPWGRLVKAATYKMPAHEVQHLLHLENDNKYYIMVFIGTFHLEVFMAKNTSITLGDHFDTFIFSQLESGRYGSASEIVRAGLRLLEDSESKLQALRQMLIQGEESGNADYNYKDFLSELDEQKR
jgi:antitoxin ParD1/3/4